MSPEDKTLADETLMDDGPAKIRTCCNCRHITIEEEGYEVGGLEDTRYMVSSCAKLGWKVKEHYLFMPKRGTGGRYEIAGHEECPFWEECEIETG